MKSQNGVDFSFTEDFEVELSGDFTSDLSPNLERMLASQNSFSVDDFVEAILTGFECGISKESLTTYIDKLNFNAVDTNRAKKALSDFISGNWE